MVHDPKEVSDGYHTFRELYDHRRALTAALTAVLPPDTVCRSRYHHPDDAVIFDDETFIVVIMLPNVGQVSYHYNIRYWEEFDHVREVKVPPKWDGHTPSSTVERFLSFAKNAGRGK